MTAPLRHPLASADIARTVDILGERQTATVSRFSLRANQPLTREQCDNLATGSGTTISALFSATDAQVADRLRQMFGGR